MAAFVTKLGAIGEKAAPADLCQNVLALLKKAKSSASPSLLDKLRGFFAQQKLALAGVVSFCLLIAIILPNLRQNGPIEIAKVTRSASGISLSGGTVDLDGLVVDATRSAIRVEKGSKLTVPRGSRVNLQFGDGSYITASRSACFEVLNEGMVLQKGRLDLSMTKNGIGFIVKTPHADVIVRGTMYSVEVGKATRVHVTEGSVAVESRLGGDELVLHAGDKVSVLPSGQVKTRLVNGPTTPVTATEDAAGQSEDTRLGISDEN